MHKIVIRIWRGVVTGIYSNDPNTDVVILDEDSGKTIVSFQMELPPHQVYQAGQYSGQH